jgi:CDP-diacylglycerol--serine O-phosphatidyltransferase
MLKHIPNTITIFNLLAGCYAIVLVFTGHENAAGWAIIAAAVFDFFDGLAARLLNAKSGIGNLLDSLADVVSFGVAPGMVMYSMIALACKQHDISAPFQSLLPLLAFLIPAAAAIRLARFSSDDSQAYSFKGLPSPANGLFIGTLPMYLTGMIDPELLKRALSNPWILLLITFVFSWLMISPLKMFSMKFRTMSWRDNAERYILIIAAVVLIALFHLIAIQLIIILYILLSLFSQRYHSDQYKTK